MHHALKLKVTFLFMLLAVAAYALIPTFVYFSLNETELKDVRRNKDAFANYIPAWSMTNHIVPGLDLQGGIHMVLGVDVDKALSDKTGRTADRLRDFAKEKEASFTEIEQITETEDNTRIMVIFANNNDIALFNKNILSQFGELKTISETDKNISLQLDPSIVLSTRRDAVDQTITSIRNRIDKMGVTEPSISKRGEDQVQIQLPGYDNPEEAKSLIGRTAQLEFQMCDDETLFLTNLKNLPEDVKLVKSGYSKPNGTNGNDIFLTFPEGKLSEVKAFLKHQVPKENVIKFGKQSNGGFEIVSMRTYTLHKKVVLTGDDLIDTRVSLGSESDPRPGVAITFNATGARIFDELTAANIGNRMAIVLEDLVDSSPYFSERISGGSARISMGSGSRESSIKDANQLSLVLKSGALPAPVTFREERSVGPSLGADSVKNGQNAFLVGSLLVILFMLLYYRLSGLFSIIAVMFNVIFMLATLAFLGATITLPGVAGILLTVSMAVDANVIINERIREELRKMKTPRSAVQAGYEAAFSAVIDANVTTFIAGLVLWQYGSGPVQNFATMLLIGTVTSVFTAIFITRIFFEIATARNPKHLSI
ncbi:MAG: protein translocase subunit SecD [bacterium]|nr:protein translocase subunit SecD [bacterium]